MLEATGLAFKVSEGSGERFIVKDASFTVENGEMLVITGPNGGGKSTLARALMGLVPSSGGRLKLDGVDITDFSVDERAKAGMGYAFQQPSKFKGMTVNRLISIAAGKSVSNDECCAVLSRVGLCARDYVNREIDGTLSGGEMKRLEIATVLSAPHKISIFDEPEAGIDLWSFSMLIKEFERIHAKGTNSLILISHQERIISMADRIMVIDNGRITALGKREDILPKLLRGDDMCGCLERGNTEVCENA